MFLRYSALFSTFMLRIPVINFRLMFSQPLKKLTFILSPLVNSVQSIRFPYHTKRPAQIQLVTDSNALSDACISDDCAVKFRAVNTELREI